MQCMCHLPLATGPKSLCWELSQTPLLWPRNMLIRPPPFRLSWALAFPAGMGLEGAALGAALSNNLRFILLLLYVVSPMGKWSHACWGGFSREALDSWGDMVKLSAAGVAATLAEWGAFEILTLSTSYISTEHLAAQTILVSAANDALLPLLASHF